MFGLFKDIRERLDAISDRQQQQAEAIAGLATQMHAVQQQLSGLGQAVEAAEGRLHTRLQSAGESQADLSAKLTAGWERLSSDIQNSARAINKTIDDLAQAGSRQHETAIQEVRTTADSLRSAVEATATDASETTKRTGQRLEEIRDQLTALQSRLESLTQSTGQALERAESLTDIADQIAPMNSQFFHLVSEIRTRVDEIGREMDNLVVANMAAAGKAMPGRRRGRRGEGDPDG